MRNKNFLITFLFYLVVILSLCSCNEVDNNSNERFPSDNTIIKKEGREYVFDMEALPVICIKVKEDTWEDLLVKRDIDYKTKEYFECDFSLTNPFDTIEIKNSGLRLHGNTSRVRPEGNMGLSHKDGEGRFHHCHYMVNLSKYVKDEKHEINGVKKIIFKCFRADPSYVREIYAYDLFRRYGIWTIAYSSYCRLYLQIQDEKPVNLGVYAMFEVVDEDYLKLRKEKFDGDSGYLWKCAGVGLNKTDDDLFFVDDNSTVDHPYELKEGKKSFDIAKQQIKGFISKFKNLTGDDFHTWIKTVCDVDFLLKTYAVSVALGNWDDYWNNYNNYYIYFNSRDIDQYKFYFIPYDLDECLGRTKALGAQNDAVIQDPLHWGVEQNELISKIISYPDFRQIYIDALKELASPSNTFLTVSSSIQRIDCWHKLIGNYVANDTGDDMVIEDRPGPYSDQDEYRLWNLSGKNFFVEKCRVLNALGN